MAQEKQLFGLYTKESGSYTLGNVRFEPGKPVPVSEEIVAKACRETSPVKFFTKAEKKAGTQR